MREYIIGVDVGGTTIKIGKFNNQGDLLEKWNIRTDRSNHGDNILKDIVVSISDNTSWNEIIGIGLGVPGPVKNNVVIHCVNLGWGRKDLVKEMHVLLKDSSIIVKAGNDANVAAAGEMYKGAAQGFSNVLMFTLGTGVGGGIVIDGKLVEGVNGSGGELGHVIVDNKHNFTCNCGKKGCLETVASATGIVTLAKERLAGSKAWSPLRRFDEFSAKKVFDCAKDNDLIAKQTIDESMRYLALAMSTASLTLDPDIIVIGGGVSNAGEIIIEYVNKYFYDMVKPFIMKAKIVLASLGNDAGIYGCAYLIR